MNASKRRRTNIEGKRDVVDRWRTVQNSQLIQEAEVLQHRKAGADQERAVATGRVARFHDNAIMIADADFVDRRRIAHGGFDHRIQRAAIIEGLPYVLANIAGRT